MIDHSLRDCRRARKTAARLSPKGCRDAFAGLMASADLLLLVSRPGCERLCVSLARLRHDRLAVVVLAGAKGARRVATGVSGLGSADTVPERRQDAAQSFEERAQLVGIAEHDGGDVLRGDRRILVESPGGRLASRRRRRSSRSDRGRAPRDARTAALWPPSLARPTCQARYGSTPSSPSERWSSAVSR